MRYCYLYLIVLALLVAPLTVSAQAARLEQPGPRVRTVLTGGPPVVPVVALVESIRPEIRQRDVRIAVLVYELLHRPFLTVDQAATALQSDAPDAESRAGELEAFIAGRTGAVSR
jgi:ATP-dependent DNA helicase RecG